MNTKNFIPLNRIEMLLVQAKSGQITLPNLIDIFLKEKFFMPSTAIVDNNGIGFSPLLFDRGEISMAAIFTEKTRAEIYNKKIKDMIIISFRDILNNIPENYGVVVNPGYTEGLELLPHGIKNIKRDFLFNENT